jgi:hypothetical protein
MKLCVENMENVMFGKFDVAQKLINFPLNFSKIYYKATRASLLVETIKRLLIRTNKVTDNFIADK